MGVLYKPGELGTLSLSKSDQHDIIDTKLLEKIAVIDGISCMESLPQPPAFSFQNRDKRAYKKVIQLLFI